MQTAKRPRPDMNEVIGAPPPGTPKYGGPPMTLELWISKYLPKVAARLRKIEFSQMEQMNGPYDASDLMPPGAKEPAKYPAYFFMKPVHTFPEPGGLEPAFGPYHGKFQAKTQFYFTKPDAIRFWLEKTYGTLKPERVLDLACGIGSTTFVMAELWPDAEVVGVDLSPSMVRFARRRAEERGIANIRFYHMDAGEMGHYPDEYFDVVNESYMLHEVPTYHGRAVVKEMIRLSKPGHAISWFDWPPAESDGDLERRKRIANGGSEPFMLQYLDLQLERWLPELGLQNVNRAVRAGANMLVVGTKPAAGTVEYDRLMANVRAINAPE